MKKTAPFLLSLLMTGALCASAQAQQAQPASSGSKTPTAVSPTTPAATSTEAQASSGTVEAAGSRAAGSAPAASAAASADGTLPVSLDRIKKALKTEPAGRPIQRTSADGEQPRFVVETKAPRTLALRSYLDDGTAVPGYVRPAYDPYHYEFLEMVTPDAAKGCAQFSDQGCAQMMTSRVASGLVWQQLFSRGVDNVLRGIFKPQR